MATGNDSGNEREPESEFARKLSSNLGRFYEGRWYCDCPGDCLAILRQAGESTENPGKWFWRCSKSRDEQCSFFLWAKDDGERKARLAKLGVLPPPKTPTSTKWTRPDDPAITKSSENPWSIAKRKLDPKDVPDENEDGSPSDRTIVADEMEEFEDMDTPSRKAAKTTSFSTPRLTVRERPGSAAQSLPTPRSGKQPMGIATASGSRTLDGTSHTLGLLQHEIGLGNEKRSNLTTTILDLIDSENIQLKESTILKICNKVDLELDRNEAAVRRYEKTISQLSERNDYWKSIALQERGDVAVNKTFEPSD